MNKVVATMVLGGFVALGGTFSLEDAINPYVSKQDSYEMRMTDLNLEGETKTIVSKIEPKVILSKWNGQGTLGVKYLGLNSQGEKSFLSSTIKWEGLNESMEAYPLKPQKGMESGGFEIELHFKEKPQYNTFDFQLEGWQNFDFYKQLPLWKKKGLKAPTATCTDTSCDGTQRPENTVNSYAVYHKTLKDYTVGGINFSTGKHSHIYRLKFIDGDGKESWADMNYMGNGILRAEIPKDVFDSTKNWDGAVLDPTFGYTTVGTAGFSTSDVTNHDMIGTFTVFTEGGTVSQMTAAVTGSSGAAFKGVIVRHSDMSIITNGISDASTDTIPTSPTTLVNVSFASNPTVSRGAYVLMLVGGGNDVNVYFDDGLSASTEGFIDEANSYTSPANPDSLTYNNNRYSIYATYSVPSRTITTANFSYCRTMTMTAGGGSGGVATTTTLGFPLVATTTLADLAATTSSGKVQKSTYDSVQNVELPLDIVFGNEASCYANASIDALPHYFEKWATTTGAIAAWVLAPDISSTSAKVITMYYGNSSMTNDLNSAPQVFATSSYQKPVYQFDLSQLPRAYGNGLRDFFDLTYNFNHASSSGGITDVYRSGYIGNGLFFDGTNDGLLTIFPPTGLSTTSITVLFMASSTNWASGVEYRPFSIAVDANNFIDVTKSSSNNFIGRYMAGSTLDQAYASAASYVGWKQFAMTISKPKDQLKVFHDGAQISTTQTSLGTFSSGAIVNSYIGRSSGNYWSGSLDDVRLYATDLDPMDIKTIFNNVINSAVFWTFGGEVGAPATGGEPSPFESFWDDI